MCVVIRVLIGHCWIFEWDFPSLFKRYFGRVGIVNIVVVVVHSTPPSHCQGGQWLAATWLIKLYHENTSHNMISF